MPIRLLMAMVLVAAGCSTPGQSLTPISAEAATSVALAQSGGGPDAKVVSTRLSTYGAEAEGGATMAAETPVWVVVLSGVFHFPSCGPMTATPHPCLSPATSAQILVDARTGAFIQGRLPAPSGG